MDITVAAGKEDGDTASQITAIENAISARQKGILITPNGPGVNPAIKKARDAGLFVIALDTPPDPPDTVDITFATDNFEAGKLIGKWAAAQLGGKAAVIAMIDDQADKITSVDVGRDHGFLTGMGIDVGDARPRTARKPRPASTPAARAATTEIVGHQAVAGRRGRRPDGDGDAASPRTPPSTSSTPSTSRPRTAPTRPSRPPARTPA